MPVQRHVVVMVREDGGVEVHALKAWLRQHPEVLPDLEPNSSTSHQLRAALLRQGWSKEETEIEFRLFPPGTNSNAAIVNEVLGPDDAASDADPELTFSLEYQLRDFIASNISTMAVNGRRLRLFVDGSGRDGIEYPSAVGQIDILAIDDSGAFFVFELKRANSPDRAIGQLARYMGWVQRTIGKEKGVFGVIVAKSVSENLRYAVSVVPNVYLYEYEVDFRLNSAHELTKG